MGKEEKKFEELYNALKNAAFVLCFRASYDESCQRCVPCQYAWANEDGIPECMMKPDFENYFGCPFRKYIEVLNKYKKQGNE